MSKLEVDKIDPQSGTALEIGSSGDTITIPSGATLDASNATTTLPANVVTTDGTQTLTNKSIAATQLTGTITPSDGTVTNAKVNASAAIDYSKLNLTGNIALADLSATGTKDATTFLRGDNTFAEAGGGAFEKISTTTISSAVSSVDFNTLSTDYEDFRIIISNLNIDTNQQYITLRVKRSGQGSFDSGASDYLTSGIGRDAVGNTITTNSTGLSYIRISNDNVNGTLAWSPFNATVDIYNPHSTVTKCFAHCLASMSNGTYAHITTTIAGGYRNSTDAVIGLQIGVTSGNLDGGKLTLYGRKI